jgi:hypothetical protein
MKKERALAAIGLFAIILVLGFLIYLYSANRVTGNSALGEVRAYVLPGLEIIPLYTGWNFVSIYVNLPNYSVENALSSLGTQYEYVLEWNDTSQDFSVWSRKGAKQFTELNPNKSYFVFMGIDKNLTVSGLDYYDLKLSLPSGWDSPIYPYRYPIDISGNKFYNVTFSYILKWDYPGQEFKVYSPESAVPEFNQLLRSEGCFIRSAGGQLIYSDD